jgi:hypothetical protein
LLVLLWNEAQAVDYEHEPGAGGRFLDLEAAQAVRDEARIRRYAKGCRTGASTAAGCSIDITEKTRSRARGRGRR